MKTTFMAVIAAFSMICATISFAESVTLAPADPQPKKLKQGLAVKYAYKRLRSLSAAASAAKKAKKANPLAGLDYPDTKRGDLVMTARTHENVVAEISGYIRFDAPGTFGIDFLTNDGLVVHIGGQEVGKYDGIHACQTTRVTDIVVPKAGWYELNALYFQKEGTSCLQMRMKNSAGKLAQVPNSAFGYN